MRLNMWHRLGIVLSVLWIIGSYLTAMSIQHAQMEEQERFFVKICNQALADRQVNAQTKYRVTFYWLITTM